MGNGNVIGKPLFEFLLDRNKMSRADGIIDGYCWCGCGTQTRPDKRGVLYRYVYGHHAKGQLNPRFGVKLSVEQKEKISEGNKGKHSGEKNQFYGKKHSLEQKQKWASDRKGRDAGSKNPFYGRKHSEETKEILRKTSALNRSKQFVLPSLPEKIIHDELRKISIPFETEKLINNKFCVDIYIETYNLIIYIDGCYWHACPIHFPNSKKPNTDNARIPYLSKCGYNVEVIWEHDIKNNLDQTFKEICQKFNMKNI